MKRILFTLVQIYLLQAAFGQDFRLDSIVCERFDRNLNRLALYSKTVNSAFDSKGRITQLIDFRYNNGWNLSRQTNITYDNADNLVEQSFSDWNSTTQTWIPAARFVWTYNNFNAQTSFLQQTYDKTLQSWVNQWRQIWTINDPDIIIKSVSEVWEDSVWLRNRTSNYELYPNNLTKIILTEEWDDLDLIWVQSRESFTYYPNGLEETSARAVWDTVSMIWKNQTRTTNFYNADSTIARTYTENWDANNNVWANNGEDIYQYDSNGWLTKYTYNIWNGVAWAPLLVQTRRYDLKGNLINLYSEIATSGTLRPNQNCNYFYSRVTNVQEIADANRLRFENPYRAGSPIFCDCEGKISANVFDENGRKIQSQNLENQQVFELQNLPKTGIYFLKLTQNGISGTTKKLIYTTD